MSTRSTQSVIDGGGFLPEDGCVLRVQGLTFAPSASFLQLVLHRAFRFTHAAAVVRIRGIRQEAVRQRLQSSLSVFALTSTRKSTASWTLIIQHIAQIERSRQQAKGPYFLPYDIVSY